MLTPETMCTTIAQPEQLANTESPSDGRVPQSGLELLNRRRSASLAARKSFSQRLMYLQATVVVNKTVFPESIQKNIHPWVLAQQIVCNSLSLHRVQSNCGFVALS